MKIIVLGFVSNGPKIVCSDPSVSDTPTHDILYQQTKLSFTLPDGQLTMPCKIQEKLPHFFKRNEKFGPAYFLSLHKEVKSHGNFNYCGAKIVLSHTMFDIKFFEDNLVDYHDHNLVEFLKFGFPPGY